MKQTQIMYTDEQREYYTELCRIYNEFRDKKIEELKKLNTKIEKHTDKIEELIDNLHKDDEDEEYKYELLDDELNELERRVIYYDNAKAKFYAKTKKLPKNIIEDINFYVYDKTLKKIAQKIYKLYLASKKIKSKELMHKYKRAYDYILNNASTLATIQNAIYYNTKQIKELITKHKINELNDEQSMQIIKKCNNEIQYFKYTLINVDEYAYNLTFLLDGLKKIKDDIVKMIKTKKKTQRKNA